MSPSLGDAHQTLRDIWGYEALHLGQRKAIAAVLHRRDALAVLPTGGGKSLCYQLPGLLLPGVTVVVSPLISLMQDQVAALRRRQLPAAYLSSTQTADVQRAVWEAVAAGRVKLLYVAPERMAALVERLPRGAVALLAVDEAHCISEWGHEFRPHYRALGVRRRALGRPPTLAVTATATPETRADIARVLGLRRPVTVVASFDRPNLFFAVRPHRSERARLDELSVLLRRTPGSAIVYVPTRDRADGVAAILRFRGIAAAPYHAGLPGAARRALLARFLDERIRVIVATNAFGMGIDKRDVRLVAHLGVPPRPEAYYQEAGRAGRDGAPARCELLWTRGDLAITARIVAAPKPGRGGSPPYREAQRRGLATMQRYVTGRGCRRRVLLEYLGERLGRCAGCDRCSSPESLANCPF